MPGSLTCAYCGTENQEEIIFRQEIQKKIERNKLLKPFLIKQKTPELVQKMLTRILLIIFGCNVLLAVISFTFFLFGERDRDYKKIEEGSIAQAYYDTFIEMDRFYYAGFLKEANDIMEMIDNKEIPGVTDVESLLGYAYTALEDSQEEDTEAQKEEIRLTVDAFFMGYLGLSKEEMRIFEPSEDGSYDYTVDSELLNQTTKLIVDKLQEVVR